MRWMKAVLALIVLVAVMWGLHTRLGTVPPLGKFFLDPLGGFWRNNTTTDRSGETRDPGAEGPGHGRLGRPPCCPCLCRERRRPVPHPGLSHGARPPVADGVPFALHGGRLAEVFGGRAVGMDLLQRRLGMTWGAENFLKGLEHSEDMRRVIDAYCGGVNAYIRSLRPADYPLEYKVLDYAPGEWSALDTALILKYMAWYLSGEGNDLDMTRTRAALGEAETDKLFPYHAPFQDPVVPAGTDGVLPLPGRFGSGAGLRGGGRTAGTAGGSRRSGRQQQLGGGREKTKSGFPILCGDPHLQLTLPSIWYQVQLAAPGLNVGGVSLPGTPGVVIGFNEKIAWSMTNAGSDVLDFFQMKFRGARRREYAWDDGWRKTFRRREEVRVRGGKTVSEDVLYTHLGPVPFPAPRPDMPDWVPAGAAMRWTGHDASGILASLHVLNRARGYGDFQTAMTGFDCPAQNVAYADATAASPSATTGNFPSVSGARGAIFSDGSSAADEWAGWVPMGAGAAQRGPGARLRFFGQPKPGRRGLSLLPGAGITPASSAAPASTRSWPPFRGSRPRTWSACRATH